jgi:hypothetical protein
MARMDEKPADSVLACERSEIIAVVAFVLTLIYYRTTAIQNTGRYQFRPLDRGGYLVDTQTSQVWILEVTQWHDLGEPPKPVK